jgi:hypothetical protein
VIPASTRRVLRSLFVVISISSFLILPGFLLPHYGSNLAELIPVDPGLIPVEM